MQPRSNQETISPRRPVELMFGATLADVFSAPDYHCTILDNDKKPTFAVTRLCSGPREMEKAPAYPPDQAILICVALTPTPVGQWRALYNNREVGVTKAIPFATSLIDLRCSMEMWVRGPFDYLHFYLSRELLKKIALDNGVAPTFSFRPSFFVEDLVIAQLTKTILSPVQHHEPLNLLALDQLAMLVGAHVLQQYGGTAKFATGPRRGLEAWQKLRVEEMLRARLEGNITIGELAAACSLSESHFARCFRFSFATSVHQRLIRLRLEYAKDLLLTTRKTLVDIAFLSGFCDQAAFTRTFSRIERMSPSRWRKFNGNGCVDLEKPSVRTSCAK